jgi:hypothetical protein
MKRSAQMYALILFVLLGMAWVQWTAEEPVDLEGKVVMLQGEPEAVSAVRWVSSDTEATIVRKKDARGEYFWVDYTRWSEKRLPAARADKDTGDQEPEEPEREAKKSAFKSAKKAFDMVASLSPMTARRSLNVTDEAKLKEIGLTEPSGTIEIDRAGRTQKLEVGGEAYGTRDYYVRHVESGKIFLVERDLLQPLKYARTRLPDRTLVGIERPDVVSVSLKKGDDTLALVQIHADDADKAGWALSDQPDVEAEQATTWMDRMLNLKGTRYASPGEEPEDLQLRFSVDMTDRAAELTRVEVLQVGDDGDWYARSEHTRGLVKLIRSAAHGLSDDMDGIVDGAD